MNTTYIYTLRFRLDKDAPDKYVEKWNNFKSVCESGKNKHIVEHIKDECELEQNKILPYLDRVEGGLGGNNKQIRFRYKNRRDEDIDEDIVMDQIWSTETDAWALEDLDDLISAFVKVAEYYVESECVNGYIEMHKPQIRI